MVDPRWLQTLPAEATNRSLTASSRNVCDPTCSVIQARRPTRRTIRLAP